MKKDLWQLAVQGIKGRKRSSILLLAVLSLSFMVAVLSLSVTESMNKTNEQYRYDTYGEWYGAVIYGEEEDKDFLLDSAWMESCGSTRNYGVINGSGNTVGIGTIDDNFRNIGRIRLQDGAFPKNKNEIAMEASVLSGLGYDYELGQEITLDIGFRAEGEILYAQKTYTLCGVLKAYTQLWGTVDIKDDSVLLNGAVVTEEAGEELLILADEAIDEYNGEVIRAAKESDSMETADLLTADPIVPQYYFTVKTGMEREMKQQVEEYLSETRDDSVSGQQGDVYLEKQQNHPLSVRVNELAYGVEGDISFSFVYVIMTYAATLLAVVCIYTIQMQKQVKQTALFRSVGITKKQLRWMSFFEVISLSIPAGVTGVVCGGIGVRFLLWLLVYTGSVSIQVAIPFAAILLLVLLWTMGIFAVRILVLQIALRQPLTGRMLMSRRGAGRAKSWRKTEIIILSALFCGTVFFMGMESVNYISWFRYWNHSEDYLMNAEYVGIYEELENLALLPEERLEEYRQIPGIKWANGYSRMYVYPDNESIKDSEYFKAYTKFNGEQGITNPNCVFCYSIPEEKWEDFFGAGMDELDMDAFRKGETVFVSFKVDRNDTLFLYSPEGERVYFQSEDTGLAKGDEIRFAVRGMEIRDGSLGTEKALGVISAPIAGILFYQADDVFGGNAIGSGSYSILCSEQFLKNTLTRMEEEAGPEAEYIYSNFYRTGEETGYTDIHASAGLEAGYLSTDYVLATFCKEDGLYLENFRETLSAHKQGILQTLILLYSSGTCIALVLLLIIINALTLETYVQQRKYGILQAISMSERQMKKDILKKMFSGSITAVIVGWGIYGFYFLWKAVRTFYEEGQAFSVLRFFAREEAGLSIGIFTAMGVTLGTSLLLILVWWIAKRSLLHKGLMDKLQDQN